MMKQKGKIKRLISVVLTLFCITLTLTSCRKDNISDFTQSESFERYFMPEEYEEEYNTVIEEIAIEKGKQYKLQIKAECNQGTIDITVKQDGKENMSYDVSTQQPCQETITIDNIISEKVTFIISILPVTNGNVKVDILSQ